MKSNKGFGHWFLFSSSSSVCIRITQYLYSFRINDKVKYRYFESESEYFTSGGRKRHSHLPYSRSSNYCRMKFVVSVRVLCCANPIETRVFANSTNWSLKFSFRPWLKSNASILKGNANCLIETNFRLNTTYSWFICISKSSLVVSSSASSSATLSSRSWLRLSIDWKFD